MRLLEKSRYEIRLIRLQPSGVKDGSLKCTLQYASLDDAPLYDALSDTWDEDPQAEYDSSELIPYVDNIPRRIGTSLDSALRHLRSRLNGIVIWVDAVCINQEDLEEKSWQINQMRRIYSQANCVLVWLGPSAYNSDKAIDVLLAHHRFTIRTRAYAQLGTGTIDMTKVPVCEDRSERERNFQDELIQGSYGRMFGYNVPSSVPLPPYPIAAIASLFQRKWWARIWVLQELALASNVVFFCGNRRIEDPAPDNVFRIFLDSWDMHRRVMGRQPHTLDHRPWVQFQTRFQHVDGETPLKMKALLKDGAEASLETKEPMDHIYALLGLAAGP